MSTVVLYCWCHSDSASVLLYFILYSTWQDSCQGAKCWPATWPMCQRQGHLIAKSTPTGALRCQRRYTCDSLQLLIVKCENKYKLKSKYKVLLSLKQATNLIFNLDVGQRARSSHGNMERSGSKDYVCQYKCLLCYKMLEKIWHGLKFCVTYW